MKNKNIRYWKRHTSLLIFQLIILSSTIAQMGTIKIQVPEPFVDFDQYRIIIKEVAEIRNERMITFDQLIEMQKESNTILLDTRSKEMYDAAHIEGAINLPFTEFTAENLSNTIPSFNTDILIYCNNNIVGDQINFPTKSSFPKDSNTKPNMMALNVPTYISLHGYGYKSIFELNELMKIEDSRMVIVGKKFYR